MAWRSFLLALHTPTEFLLVGVKRLSLLEQVKPRNWQVVIAEIGNGLGNGMLILSACGLLLTARSLSVLCRAGLRLIVRTGVVGRRVYPIDWKRLRITHLGHISKKRWMVPWIIRFHSYISSQRRE